MIKWYMKVKGRSDKERRCDKVINVSERLEYC